MSILTLLLLFFIAYLCFKAIGNIWNDAFKGIVSNHKQKKSSQYQDKTQQSRQSYSTNRHESKEKPIEKGEGEYVDFEDVS